MKKFALNDRLAGVAFVSVIFILVSLLCTGNIFIDAAFADGCVLQLKDGWNMAAEKRQKCAISLSDGRQRMILQVDYKSSADAGKKLWVFPVPGKAPMITLNLVKGFPVFYGDNLLEMADGASLVPVVISGFVSAGPIYFYHYLLYFSRYFRTISGGVKGGGFKVHERVEKYGFISELISLKSQDGLKNYLEHKAIVLPEKIADLMNSYIGSDFCFVFTWINPAVIRKPYQMSNYERFADFSPPTEEAVISSFETLLPISDGKMVDHEISIFLEFPSDKVFFPLKLTSVYGEDIIPIEIDYVGYLKAELPSWISGFASVDHFFNSGRPNFYMGTTINFFRGQDSDNANIKSKFLAGKSFSESRRYTRILIKAPSSKYADDLRINCEPAVSAGISEFFVENRFWIFIPIMITLLAVATKRTLEKDAHMGDWPLNHPINHFRSRPWMLLFTFMSSLFGHYVLWFNYCFFDNSKEIRETQFSYTPGTYTGSMTVMALFVFFMNGCWKNIRFISGKLNMGIGTVQLMLSLILIFMGYYAMRITFNLALEYSARKQTVFPDSDTLNISRLYNYKRAMIFVFLSHFFVIMVLMENMTRFFLHDYLNFSFFYYLYRNGYFDLLLILMSPFAGFFAFNCTEAFSIFSDDSCYMRCTGSRTAGILTVRHISTFLVSALMIGAFSFGIFNFFLGKF
ncbi:MAG: hypothetical protein CVV64_15665 [Candidatus Wallbacteria bacterium HGW-Wallbacteria-1]|uniref:Uncharacterized protein n=1 Tax=Candidatus Wallbacteria bacterium HGW-Wallbacteria-1 TaxID=2013854 RepID=A0A2N1PLB6_9BACT|nr:MAG: hypothetical protein CVV64_15665 [Candidatus Wallbacteria bacterium HGW-Wallbacteria-1]